MYNDTENFIPPIDTDISEKYNFAPERKCWNCSSP